MPPRIQRAISIRQPWVELILRGQKTHEFRPRPTNIRERVYLYASLRPADSPSAWRKVGKEKGALPVGVVVGTVEIAGCSHRAASDDYAYALRRPQRLRTPVRPKNQPQPGFWRPEF